MSITRREFLTIAAAAGLSQNALAAANPTLGLIFPPENSDFAEVSLLLNDPMTNLLT